VWEVNLEMEKQNQHLAKTKEENYFNKNNSNEKPELLMNSVQLILLFGKLVKKINKNINTFTAKLD